MQYASVPYLIDYILNYKEPLLNRERRVKELFKSFEDDKDDIEEESEDSSSNSQDESKDKSQKKATKKLKKVDKRVKQL